MLSPILSKVINVALYQIGWFSCLLGAALGFPLPGAFASLGLILLHLLLTDAPRAEVRLLLAACLVGIVVDSLQQAAGLFTFKTDPNWPLWLPLWVFVIWIQFATLLRFALHWLLGRYLLGALFGAIGGPLAYWSGIRMGAATFGENPQLTLLVLALVWALVTPLLLWARHKLAGSEGRYHLFSTRYKDA
ncbi:MAG: DUF2878 domain-containing protein [Geobacteraceae bacterium]|nr:DUF2878 domain-containing protein [Geobacteraceae bacterium]